MLKQNKNGFSLLGVIIAIFIAITGLIAILSLANYSLSAASNSKMKLIASGLAQEGIEVVRNIRESQSDWNEWYDGIVNCNYPVQCNYQVQYNSLALVSYSDTPLKIDSNGLYQYDSGNDSPFYRKISLSKISDNEVKVVVEIKWQEKGKLHSLIAEDRLWNWK